MIKTEHDEYLFVNYVLLTRQLTRLADCIFHIARLETQPDKKHGSQNMDYKGYRAYAQTEISDVIWQCKKMLDALDLDFDETVAMGKEREREKKEMYLQDHPWDRKNWI
jgi:hypothetical protein